GGVGRAAAGDVRTDALDRSVAPPELATVEILPPVVGQLALVELLDVDGSGLDRIPEIVVDLVVSAFGSVGHVDGADGRVVELFGILAQRDVALLAHALDDVADIAGDRVDAGITMEQRPPPVGREIRN